MLFKKRNKNKGLFLDVRELCFLIDKRVNLNLEKRVNERLIKDIGDMKIFNELEYLVKKDKTNLKINPDTQETFDRFEVIPAFNYQDQFINTLSLIKENSFLLDDLILMFTDRLNDFFGPLNTSERQGSLLGFSFKLMLNAIKTAKNNSYYFEDNSVKDAALMILLTAASYSLGRVLHTFTVKSDVEDKEELTYNPVKETLRDFILNNDILNIKQIYKENKKDHLTILKTGLILANTLVKETISKLDNKELIYTLFCINEDDILFKILNKSVCICLENAECDDQYLEAIRPVFIGKKHTPKDWDTNEEFKNLPYFYDKDLLLNTNIRQAVSYYANKNESVINRFMHDYKETIEQHFLDKIENENKTNNFEHTLEKINEENQKDFEKRENCIKSIQTTLTGFNIEANTEHKNHTGLYVPDEDYFDESDEIFSVGNTIKEAHDYYDDYIKKVKDIIGLSLKNEEVDRILQKDCATVKRCLDLINGFVKDQIMTIDFPLSKELNDANDFRDYFKILVKVISCIKTQETSAVVNRYMTRFIQDHLKKFTRSLVKALK